MEYIGNAFPFTKIRDLGIEIKRNEVWSIPRTVKSLDIDIAVKNGWISIFNRKFVKPEIIPLLKHFSFQPPGYKAPKKEDRKINKLPDDFDAESMMKNMASLILGQMSSMMPKSKKEGLSKEEIMELFREFNSEKKEPKKPELTKEDLREIMEKSMKEMMSKISVKGVGFSNKSGGDEYNEEEPMFIPKIDSEGLKNVTIKSKEKIDSGGLEDQLALLKKLKNKNGN